MTGPAVRSRLLVLRRERQEAKRGRELLDRRREVLLRELQVRVAERDRRNDEVRSALSLAQRLLGAAKIELGRQAVEGAALAQPAALEILRVADTTIAGVRVPRLVASVSPFRPRYGPGGTAESLDRAGAAFGAVVAALVRLTEADVAARQLQRALARTVRRLNALDKIVIIGLDREIGAVATALEEEERDEAFRRKRWLAAVRS